MAPCHPYVLRHSGPSDDHLTGTRTLDEIKKRGRWAADSSVRRYTKGARTLSQMQTWPAAVKEYMRRAHQDIGNVLLG